MSAPRPLDIYVRVSRKGDREDDRFHSPREQEERARSHLEARGFLPGEVFADIDVSGATHPEDRPAMGAALERVRAGVSGGLAAFALDRLSRDPAHGEWLVNEVTSHGGVVAAPDIPEDITSPSGEFTFAMLLGVGRLYRRTAGARFASAKERATRAGIPVGPVPVGYRQRADRALEVDPETAPAVRRVFERRANGAGLGELAGILDEATGRTWTRTGALGVVRNRLYATGRLEYGGVVSDVDAGAIVDEPLWHAAQRAAPLPQAARGGVWLLTGLAKCASCEHRLAPWRSSSREKRRRYRYMCDNRACTARASVDARKLERFVAAATIAAGDDLVTRTSAPDLGALEEAVAVSDRRLEQVLAPEARDALGDLWAADVKARRTERDEALARLGEARQRAGVPEQAFRLRDIWDDMPPPDRRAAFSLFWQEIRVHRTRDRQTRVEFVPRAAGPAVEVALS